MRVFLVFLTLIAGVFAYQAWRNVAAAQEQISQLATRVQGVEGIARGRDASVQGTTDRIEREQTSMRQALEDSAKRCETVREDMVKQLESYSTLEQKNRELQTQLGIAQADTKKRIEELVARYSNARSSEGSEGASINGTSIPSATRGAVYSTPPNVHGGIGMSASVSDFQQPKLYQPTGDPNYTQKEHARDVQNRKNAVRQRMDAVLARLKDAQRSLDLYKNDPQGQQAESRRADVDRIRTELNELQVEYDGIQ